MTLRFNRRHIVERAIIVIGLLGCAALQANAKPDLNTRITRIAFGSCAHQDHPQPIWNAINQDRPELFLFLGDNIYGDTDDMAELSRKYQKLGAKPGFKTLKKQSHIQAIWDDHDYGADDAGAEYPQKDASRKIMLDFWEEPTESPRRSREDGIYTAQVIGKPGERIQIILLDLRWNRSELNAVSKARYLLSKSPQKMGPYEPIENTQATLLGEAQWRWLEAELKKPAQLRLIVSSIQLLPEFTGWETWANFPYERNRLFALINKHKVNGVFFLSGDTHWAELSRVDKAVGYPLWELTSSGLTEEWKAISPNQHRLGTAEHRNNYGLLEIDWSATEPTLTASIKGDAGQLYQQTRLRLNDLHFAE